MTKATGLYDQLSSISSLWRAWRAVRSSGSTSRSREIRDEVEGFESGLPGRIDDLHARLADRRFEFQKSKGILKSRPGKSPRPIVLAPIENRIVQRSILDVLQAHPPVQRYFHVPTSFGGIEKRGVPEAILAAYAKMHGNGRYFVKSDINSFFTRIPRNRLDQIFTELLTDREFADFLSRAMQTELANMGILREHADEFPIHEVGVAQGCCLSPLMGNIFLHDFDTRLNTKAVTCIRYIDDFLILGPDKNTTLTAFESAIAILDASKMTCYDPRTADETTKGKSGMGETAKGFGFLGCEIRRGLIRPDASARQRLMDSVDRILSESEEKMREPRLLQASRRTLLQSLSHVGYVVGGWGNQYSYCNDYEGLRDLDAKIDERIGKYIAHYAKVRETVDLKGDTSDRRRLLGVQLLQDCKRAPVVQKVKQASSINSRRTGGGAVTLSEDKDSG